MSESAATKTVTLRIKKKYLNLIRSGEKTFEYRSASAFYMRMFDTVPNFLTLHYQNRDDKLTVRVVKVEIIDATNEMKASGFFSTERVFKIEIANIPDVKIKKKHSSLAHGFLQ